MSGYLVAILLLLLIMSYFVIRFCLYRPPEDYLGVVYRLHRFWRLVGPDEWAFVIPGLYQIIDPIDLGTRKVTVKLADLLTQDCVPIDCQLLVCYKSDPRRVMATGFQKEPEGGWNSIVESILQGIAQDAVSGFAFQQLLVARGRRQFRHRLSALLAEQVQGFGLIVTSVSVQSLKPIRVIWNALVEQWAAKSLGEASLARVFPMLEELKQQHPEIALETLLLEWASVAAKDGTFPQIMLSMFELIRGRGG